MPAIPLTPTSGGGVCIPGTTLAPADIIVSTSSGFTSSVIRDVTNSPISHAALYAGSNQIIEAVQAGVRTDQLGAALAGDTLAVAYRVKGMTPQIARTVINNARIWSGKASYDYAGAAAAGIAGNYVLCTALGIVACTAAIITTRIKRSDTFYCSELVLEAFAKAGLPLTTVIPNASRPADIVTAYIHNKLMYVGHLVA